MRLGEINSLLDFILLIVGQTPSKRGKKLEAKLTKLTGYLSVGSTLQALRIRFKEAAAAGGSVTLTPEEVTFLQRLAQSL